MTGTRDQGPGNRGFESRLPNVLVSLFSKPKLVLCIIVIIGIIAHLPIFSGAISIDTCAQLEMTHSLLAEGEFKVEGDYSNFFPPFMSILMIPFVLVGGYSADALHAFQLVMFGITIVVVYVAGARFGKRVGYFAAFAFAIDPIIYGTMTATLSEVVVVLLLVLTFDFILRGIEKPKWMVLTGFIAGLAYLTKASTGYLILVAGIVGLLWRFGYERWDLLRNRGYFLGLMVFLATVGPWMARNYLRFGYIWNGRYATDSIHYYISLPVTETVPLFFRFFAIYTLWLLLLMAPVLLSRILYRRSRVIATAIRNNQAYSALLLFVIGTLIIGAFMAAALAAYTPWSRNLPHIRYIGVIDPLIFIIIGIIVFRIYGSGKEYSHARPNPCPRPRPRPYPRKRGLTDGATIGGYIRLGIVIVILCALIPSNYSVYSYRYKFDDMAEYLNSNNVTEIWTNDTIELRYNLPGSFTLHSFSDWATVPSNATVVAVQGVPSHREPDRTISFGSTELPWLYVILNWTIEEE